MGCILASVFYRFWLILGAMLGGKIEQKAIKNGIEKTIEKRRAARWPTRRPKSLRGCCPGAARALEGLRTVTYSLNHLSPEGWWDDGKRPGASVLSSKFSGGGSGGGTQGAGGITGIPFSSFWLSCWLSGGSKTVPRHVSDNPRRTQDGPRRRQVFQDCSKALLRRPKTDPKSTKIHEKWMLRAIPTLVSFFARFLIDFQLIFRFQKFQF